MPRPSHAISIDLVLRHLWRRRPAARPGRAGRRAVLAVLEVPVLDGPHAVQLIHREAVAVEPRLGLAADDLVHLADALDALAAGERVARLLVALLEVLLPERPAAEHARRAGVHRHLDLL